ncbi:MAG: hypothetical protein H0W18_11900 [Acidobacteria bacterium]|nr:hypothetical protein [Acidobacteriota bacterium]
MSSVLRDLARHPVRHLVRDWNWKSALVSSLCRGAIFFASNLPAGVDAGLRALITELLFRGVVSGLLGSVTQSLRLAEPAWAAALTALLVLPAAGHLAEYAVHFLAGTPRLSESIAASLVFTCVTTLFNLFVMRRGVLIVGAGSGRLRDDLRLLPALLFAFGSALWRSLRVLARLIVSIRYPRTL